jgi:hypothetical protein
VKKSKTRATEIRSSRVSSLALAWRADCRGGSNDRSQSLSAPWPMFIRLRTVQACSPCLKPRGNATAPAVRNPPAVFFVAPTIRRSSPATPEASRVDKASLSGKWHAAPAKALYDDHVTISLVFEFLSQGNDSFSGTVTESDNTDYGRTSKKTRAIIDSKNKDNTISFATQGQAIVGAGDAGLASFKEYYSGTLSEAGDELRLTRLKDLQGGGEPESFVARRE